MTDDEKISGTMFLIAHGLFLYAGSRLGDKEMRVDDIFLALCIEGLQALRNRDERATENAIEKLGAFAATAATVMGRNGN